MLDGTIFARTVTGDIPEACLRRMDEGFPLVYFPQDVGTVPSASDVGGFAMVLAAASWIVLVLGLRLGRKATWIALTAAVAPTIFAVLNLSAALIPGGGPDAYISGWLWWSVDVVAVVMFLILLGMSHSRRTLLGLGFVLWGATAFGMGHLFVEFCAMLSFSDWDWDTPPGTGWITVAVLVIAGSASFWFGGRRQESSTVSVEKPESVVGVPHDSPVKCVGD